MDTLEEDRQLIRRIINEYAEVPYAYGDLRCEAVFDRDSDRYLLMVLGREGIRRVHGCLIHVDIKDGKFWIHRDGTEYGVACHLVDSGVPKDRIVLAFKSPEMRRDTEFAVA